MDGITAGTMGLITVMVGTTDLITDSTTTSVAVDLITSAVADSTTLIAHLLTEMVTTTIRQTAETTAL